MSKLRNNHRSSHAPRYRKLGDDDYAALDELEKARHNLHIDIDSIIDAWPYAVLDRDSIGFPAGRGYDSTSPRASSVRCDVCHGTGGHEGDCLECSGSGSVPTGAEWGDPTPDAVFAPGFGQPIRWLASAKHARQAVGDVARLARLHYGFDPERSHPGTPGQTNPVSTTELCAWCGNPAPDGRGADGKPLIRRVDSHAVHRTPCYPTLASQALRAGVSVGAHLAVNNSHNRKAAGT